MKNIKVCKVNIPLYFSCEVIYVMNRIRDRFDNLYFSHENIYYFIPLNSHITSITFVIKYLDGSG